MPQTVHPGEKRVVQRGGDMAAGPGACLLPQLQPDGAVPSATQRDWELGGMGGRNKPRRKQTGLQRGAQTLVVAPWVVPFVWADSGLENCSVPLTQVEVVVFPLLFSTVLQFAC